MAVLLVPAAENLVADDVFNGHGDSHDLAAVRLMGCVGLVVNYRADTFAFVH